MKQCKASKGRVLATTVSEAQVKALWLDVCRNFLIPSFVDSALDHEGLPLNMQAAGLHTSLRVHSRTAIVRRWVLLIQYFQQDCS